jgi:hypothetical protein
MAAPTITAAVGGSWLYVHPYDLDASLAPDAPGPPPIHTEYGDTDYYFL